MNIENRELADYIATYIIEEYDEAEQEDHDDLQEAIFQALEAFEGGARNLQTDNPLTLRRQNELI
jgi:hypothetical protein